MAERFEWVQIVHLRGIDISLSSNFAALCFDVLHDALEYNMPPAMNIGIEMAICEHLARGISVRVISHTIVRTLACRQIYL